MKDITQSSKKRRPKSVSSETMESDEQKMIKIKGQEYIYQEECKTQGRECRVGFV